MQEKVKPENLAPSSRSPVIPVISEIPAPGKAQGVKEPAKVKKKAQKAVESKKPTEKKASHAEFPMNLRINAYGFANFRKGLLDALGWTKGMALKIERNDDGSATLRKA